MGEILATNPNSFWTGTRIRNVRLSFDVSSLNLQYMLYLGLEMCGSYV